MIVFAGICKGKLKIVTCFARQKKFLIFLWRTKHVTISSFPLQMPAKSIVTRKARLRMLAALLEMPDFATTQAWCRKYDFRARCCWSRAGTCEKMPLSWKMHRTHQLMNATVSLSNMPGTTSGTAVRIVPSASSGVDVGLPLLPTGPNFTPNGLLSPCGSEGCHQSLTQQRRALALTAWRPARRGLVPVSNSGCQEPGFWHRRHGYHERPPHSNRGGRCCCLLPSRRRPH